MRDETNTTRIIRRSTPAAGGAAHHGGAWKVAYADFVTAMMAFFLLLWLLNATTEKQRQGLADYFNPTLIHERNGGAEALDGRDTPPRTPNEEATPAEAAFDAMVRAVEAALQAAGGESMQNRNLLRHVVTRVSDEGLVIELGDLTEAALFADGTAEPTPALRELAQIVARALGRVRNRLAVSGHVTGVSTVRMDGTAWSLSDQRAHRVRDLLEGAGTDPRRVQRVTAFGDRQNRTQNPMDPANNRIEVILLRQSDGR